MYENVNTLDCAARRFVLLPATEGAAPCGVEWPLAGDEGECCANTEWPNWPTHQRGFALLTMNCAELYNARVYIQCSAVYRDSRAHR